MAMTDALHITVRGVPAPQGSKTRGANGGMYESSKKVKPWRQDVKYAALEAIANGAPTFPTGGVIVGVAFRFTRPGYHYRSGRFSHLLGSRATPVPSVKPDIDKITRSTYDALGEAGVFKDDAQIVCDWHTKEWDDRGEGQGATIIVRAAVEQVSIMMGGLRLVTS